MIQALMRRFGYAPIQNAKSSVQVGYSDGSLTEPSGFAVVSGSPENDYAEEWRFPNLVTTARVMMADPQIAKEIRCIRFPLINAPWVYEPASDDARDIEVADFCNAVLLTQDTERFGPEFHLATPWRQRLGEILRFLIFGFSHFCRTERREGRYTLIADLKYLLPESIDASGFLCEDESNPDILTAILRSYVDAQGDSITRQRVTMDKIVWYTFDQEGGNFLGRPLLRDMFKPFYYKDRKERLEMINTQKTKVGIPYAMARKDATQPDKDKLADLAKSMRMGDFERIWAQISEGDDFGWKEGGTSDKGFPAAIERHNQEIATAGLSQFMELGNTDASSNRGLAGTKAGFASLMIGAISGMIPEMEMQNVRYLCDINYPGLKRYPTLKCGEIDPMEKTRAIPEALTAIKQARDLGDVELENEVRVRYGFMEVDPDSIPKPVLPTDDGGKTDPSEPDAEGDDTEDEGAAGAPATLKRLAAAHDELVGRHKINLERIKQELGKYEDIYFASLRSVLGQMRDDVVGRVATGQLEPTAPKDVKVSASLTQELRNRLKASVLGTRDFGRDELLAEIKRQVRGGRVVLDADPTTRRSAISFANTQAEVLVEVDVKAIVDRLQAQTVEQYNQLLLQYQNPAQIAEALDAYLSGISDTQLLQMARGSTSTAFNLGRNVGIQESKANLEPYVVRVEVLDENTCEVCEDYLRRMENGEKFLINSREYFSNMPPAGCLGRENCRGFYVAEAKDLAA